MNRFYVYNVAGKVVGVTAERFALASARVEKMFPAPAVAQLVFSVETPESHEEPIELSELESEV